MSAQRQRRSENKRLYTEEESKVVLQKTNEDSIGADNPIMDSPLVQITDGNRGG